MKKLYYIISAGNLQAGNASGHPETGEQIVPLLKCDKFVMVSEHSADIIGAHLAAKNPGVQYHVLESKKIFEATEPNVLHKKWNESGELGIAA